MSKIIVPVLFCVFLIVLVIVLVTSFINLHNNFENQQKQSMLKNEGKTFNIYLKSGKFHKRITVGKGESVTIPDGSYRSFNIFRIKDGKTLYYIHNAIIEEDYTKEK